MADRRFARTTLVAILAALAVSACGEKPESLLVSAKDYLARNDAGAAIIQLKSALQANPQLAEGRFLLGRALRDQGDFRGAEVELRRALEFKYPADQVLPVLADVMLNTGQAKKLLADFPAPEFATAEGRADWLVAVAFARVTLGEIDQARESMKAAAAARPDYPPTLLAQARFAMADRNLPAALEQVEAVLAKEPGNGEAWKFKGDLLAQKEGPEAALPAYRKAVELRANSVSAHGALVSTLLQTKQTDEAGQRIAAMKKVAPKNLQTLLVEAQYLYEKKEYAQARDVLQDALRAQPDNPRLLLLAGAIHYQLNSLPQAEDFLMRTVKALPQAAPARRMLAIVQLRLGQPAKALTAIEPLLEDGGEDADLLSLAGSIYMQNGMVQRAEELFSRAAALDPTDPRKRTSVALAHMSSGKTDSAFAELEKIASADKGTTAEMALIASSLRRKEFARALKAVDSLEKKQGATAQVHTLRGTVHAARGDLEAARRSFDTALAANAAYLPAAAALARLDLAERKPDDARKRYEGVLAADARNLEAMLLLAELKLRTRADPAEVESLLNRALQAHPTEVPPRVALMNFHLARNDFKKALTVGQEAVAALPNRPELLSALGRAQVAAGDTNQASATFAKLGAVLPDSAASHFRLAELQTLAKDRNAAMQSLRRALNLTPDYLPAQRALILLNLEAKDLAAADKVVQEIRRQRPSDGISHALEGDIAVVRKDWPAAEAAYRAALKKTAATEVAIKLYRVLAESGKGAAAERHAATWMADHPKDLGMRMFLGEIALVRKDYMEAIKHYHAVLGQQPDNPMVLNNMAWAMREAKDPRAMEFAQKANRLAPNQPAIADTLATLLADKGDVAGAIDLLQKTLAAAPEASAPKLNLARLLVKSGKGSEARRHLEELARLGDRFPAQAEVAKLLKEAGG